MAHRIGFGDRRTIAAIESLQRGLTFEELEKLCTVLKQSYNEFSNPYLLYCAEEYRYLLTGKVAQADIGRFTQTMNEFVGNYRCLLDILKIKDRQRAPKFDFRLPLTAHSSTESALNAGLRVASMLGLGNTPRYRLQTALEQKLGIFTLMLDASSEAIAGATLSLPEVSFICVNRQLAQRNRNFAIARGLFALLTWETLPDASTPKITKKLRKVTELANVFARSLLLLPRNVAAIEVGGSEQTVREWIAEAPPKQGVSVPELQLIIQQISQQTGQDLVTVLTQLQAAEPTAKIQDNQGALPLSRAYVDLVAKAVDDFEIGAMTAIKCLGCETHYEAGELFHAYRVAAPQVFLFAMPEFRQRFHREKDN